jgi:TRAP transporter 4TM/12TM fusion protein
MAAFIGVPYIKVAIAAAIPAILYFLAVGTSVHSSCLKYGLKGIPEEQLPRRMDVLKKSYLLSPLILVLVVLLMGYSVVRTGFCALISIVLLSFVSRDTFLTPRKITRALSNAGKMVLQLTATCAAAGLIMNLVLLSGLGMKIPFLISAVAGDNLFMAVAIVGLSALVLSTGMPSNAGYIIGAVLMSSVLIDEYNVPILAAHMFVLYYAIISNITPPVSLAAYAAASLAGTNLWSTGLKAFILAASGFVIPFLFIKEPALLLQGSVAEIVIASVIAIIVVTSLSLALFGFLLRKLSMLTRVLLFSIPVMTLGSYYISGFDWLRAIAVILFVLIMIAELFRGRFGNAKDQLGYNDNV